MSESFWEMKQIEIDFSIAHEVAHAYFKDEISSFDDMDEKIRMPREIQADKTAVKWLRTSYDEKDLRKLCTYWK